MRSPAQPLPALLQIVQERIHPGAEQAYGVVEEQLANLCARTRCPNRYLALVSAAAPKEVWWLNTYSSPADVERITEAYARNPALTAAMREIARGKKGLTSEPVERMLTLRADFSDGSPWRIGEQRFAVVLETQTPVRGAGAVFEERGNRAFVFAAAADGAEAERAVSRLGPGARVFEVQPRWSFPREFWVERNPALWKR